MHMTDAVRLHHAFNLHLYMCVCVRVCVCVCVCVCVYIYMHIYIYKNQKELGQTNTNRIHHPSYQPIVARE